MPVISLWELDMPSDEYPVSLRLCVLDLFESWKERKEKKYQYIRVQQIITVSTHYKIYNHTNALVVRQ